MKAVKISVLVALLATSAICFFVALTANLFVDDVLLATYATVFEGSNPGVGRQLIEIMANGYLTIIDKNHLIVTVVISSVVFYISAYLLAAVMKGYPVRSLFTRNYWFQFDFGFTYRPFVPKSKKSETKKPG